MSDTSSISGNSDDDDNMSNSKNKDPAEDGTTFSVGVCDKLEDIISYLIITRECPDLLLLSNASEKAFQDNKALLTWCGYSIVDSFARGSGSIVCFRQSLTLERHTTFKLDKAASSRCKDSTLLALVVKSALDDKKLRIGVYTGATKDEEEALSKFVQFVNGEDENISAILFGISSQSVSGVEFELVLPHLLLKNIKCNGLIPFLPTNTVDCDMEDPENEEVEICADEKIGLVYCSFKEAMIIDFLYASVAEMVEWMVVVTHEKFQCQLIILESCPGSPPVTAYASRHAVQIEEGHTSDEMDVTPYLAWRAAALSPAETSTAKFTAADKDYYPVNFSEQEVSEALKHGRGLTCPGQGPCSFSDVGGLGETIDIVRKTIRLPLLCPEFYSEFRIRPKKGLIFYGPPGVGKTMTARALVDACKSYTNQRIAFFMRKGSDMLNSYVGQSEANVTKLFDAAKQMSPSIIFLDEFDALGSIRTPNSHNHVESNVVSTLLALMDGLDDRGLVFVIAATNRLDAIDPAFRRPGRFDVEISFELPDLEARRDILTKATSTWMIKPCVLDVVAEKTDGFNGADLVSVCESAALKALEKENPALIDCGDEDFPEIRIKNIRVTIEDFNAALKTVKASRDRLKDK